MTRRFPAPKPGLVLVALLAAALAACETPSGVMAPSAPEPVLTVDAAEKAERNGEFVIAAREYERLAEAAKSPAQEDFRLRAVQALIKAGELREARHRLEQVYVAGLDPSFAARKQILEARLLMLAGQHERAARLLHDAAGARNLNPTLIAEIHAARAQAELALDNPFGAARNLIAREQYLAGREAVADNQMQLWKILEAEKRSRLSAELDVARDPVLAGWIELAVISVDAAENPATVQAAIERWKKTYPSHPAGDPILSSLLSRAPRLPARFARAALLLPLTSPYGTAAAAVRDGFLAMHNANNDADKPTVRVYDIGADPAQAPAFLAQAVTDGAQIVIGPLGREATDAIVRGNSLLTVPTLLLSHTEENVAGAGRYVFQFGLPPEQEARQVADRAWLDGHRNAAVLSPKDAWGERMREAFVAHWQRLGGTVLATEAYDNPQGDYSDFIKKLLNVEQSEARKHLLEKRIGRKVEFEARARQDLDFIFLAADAKRGRLIKPQLNFYRASRVPVYATSHIYTGRNDPVHDVDLDGVLFADMPWMLVSSGKLQVLREALQQNWPNAQSDLDRLYALGVDSYAILPNLGRISANTAARFTGVTSELSLDPQGRLQRHLLWAQFKKGVPRLVDSAAKPRTPFEVEAAGG
jgi:outer membrane PBP1 activator LpoA protein